MTEMIMVRHGMDIGEAVGFATDPDGTAMVYVQFLGEPVAVVLPADELVVVNDG